MNPSTESQTQPDELKIINDFTCTFCDCLCDDLVITVENNQITKSKNACDIGNHRFLNFQNYDGPVAFIEGKPVSYDKAIDKTVEILTSSKQPLTFGLAETTTESQRVAVAISDWIGGVIDTTTSLSQGSSGLVMQQVGEVTCTMGEIKNRADFILFVGADPVKNQPRHFERFSLTATGEFIPNGRKDRTAVLINTDKNETANDMDQFLHVKPDSYFELLWAMRAILKDIDLDDSIEQKTGISLKVLKDLVKKMKKTKYGVILFGKGLSASGGNQLNTEAVHLLARDLNQFTRWASRSINATGNSTGADNVLTWSTGYPFSVNLGRGYPRYNPGEFSISNLLAQKEADSAFIIASDPLSALNQAAKDHLKSIPSIVIGSENNDMTKIATVSMMTSTNGIHTSGTVYRMDHVPLPICPALKSSLKSDFDILTMIEKRIRRHIKK